MTARTAAVITIIIGVIWMAIGLIYTEPLRDFGLGAVVAASGAAALGLIDWLQDRP